MYLPQNKTRIFPNSSSEEYGVTMLNMYCTGNSLKNEVCYVGVLCLVKYSICVSLNQILFNFTQENFVLA